MVMASAAFIAYQHEKKNIRAKIAARIGLKNATEILAKHGVPYSSSLARDFLLYSEKYPQLPDDFIITQIRKSTILAFPTT